MENSPLYKDGVRKLINLSKEVSELYREMHETIQHLMKCNSESVLFDSLYLQELLLKKDGLTKVYEQLYIQIFINSYFDMKSWKSGKYSYDFEGVASRVEEFNQRYQCNINVEDVIKSLRFEYEIDVNISRKERI
ncbi:hypothetical protein ACFDTO_13750 [Microbacteriaceae bacterium 4G12]